MKFKNLFVSTLCTLISIPLIAHSQQDDANLKTLTLPPIELVGSINAKIATIEVPIAQANALLPTGLELASEPLATEGTHFISLFLQKTTGLNIKASPLPAFSPYNELVLVVNDVRIKGGTKIYSYFSRLYLDSALPVILGYYLGFPKHLGNFHFGSDEFWARNEFNQPLVSMKLNLVPMPNPITFEKNYDELKATLARPVIAKGYGPLVCSKFDFDFDSAKAYPIESAWDLTASFMKAIAGSYIVPGLDSRPAGGVSLEASWALKGPLPCDP